MSDRSYTTNGMDDDSNGSWDSDALHLRDSLREPTRAVRRRPALNPLGTVRRQFEPDGPVATADALESLRKAGLLLLLLLPFHAACTNSKPEVSQAAAEQYIKHIPGATGVECTDRDSNSDGYCSCTVFRGSADPMAIECGCERWCVWNCARGCKYVPFAGGKGR